MYHGSNLLHDAEQLKVGLRWYLVFYTEIGRENLLRYNLNMKKQFMIALIFLSFFLVLVGVFFYRNRLVRLSHEVKSDVSPVDNVTALKLVQFGERVIYDDKQSIHFPDFDLLFIGISEYPVPNNPSLKTVVYNFRISKGSTTEEIGWSGGLGMVAPAPFEFEGKKYFLEKGYSQKLSLWLEENELVITE